MFPKAISEQFSDLAVQIVKKLIVAELNKLIKIIPDPKPIEGRIIDAEEDLFSVQFRGMMSALDELQGQFLQGLSGSTIQNEIEKNIRLLDEWTRARTVEAFRRNFSELEATAAIRNINLRSPKALAETVARLSKQSSDLIITLGRNQIEAVKNEVVNALNEGISTDDLVAKINNISKTTESHARLLARDQVGKISAGLSKEKQTAGGVPGYIWRTQKNLRVRGRPGGLYPDAINNHWDNEGKFFTWANGWDAPDGRTLHPGDDYQCQCFSEPSFEVEKAEIK